MSWAFDEVEQLWTGQDEVEYLRHKEEDERLAKVSLKGDGGECHSGEIAEGVPWECFGGVPIRYQRWTLPYLCRRQKKRVRRQLTSYATRTPHKHPPSAP
jgi:hypothetical protein